MTDRAIVLNAATSAIGSAGSWTALLVTLLCTKSAINFLWFPPRVPWAKIVLCMTGNLGFMKGGRVGQRWPISVLACGREITCSNVRPNYRQLILILHGLPWFEEVIERKFDYGFGRKKVSFLEIYKTRQIETYFPWATTRKREGY